MSTIYIKKIPNIDWIFFTIIFTSTTTALTVVLFYFLLLNFLSFVFYLFLFRYACPRTSRILVFSLTKFRVNAYSTFADLKVFFLNTIFVSHGNSCNGRKYYSAKKSFDLCRTYSLAVCNFDRVILKSIAWLTCNQTYTHACLRHFPEFVRRRLTSISRRIKSELIITYIDTLPYIIHNFGLLVLSVLLTTIFLFCILCFLSHQGGARSFIDLTFVNLTWLH